MVSSQGPLEDLQIALVLEVLRGQLSVQEACARANTTESRVQGWIDAFLAAGTQALKTAHASSAALIRGYGNPKYLDAFIEHIADGVWCAVPARPIHTADPPEDQARALLCAPITLCNLRFAHWSGLRDTTEIIGKTLPEVAQILLDTADQAKLYDQLVGFIQNGHHYQTPPLRKQMRDGHTRWIVDVVYCSIEDDHIVCMWRHLSDVSEYIRRQQAIAESEAHLRSYIQHSKDAIWCLDLADDPADDPLARILGGCLTITNTTLHQLLGLSSSNAPFDPQRTPALPYLARLIGEPSADEPTLRAILSSFIANDYQPLARETQTNAPPNPPRWTLHSVYAVVENDQCRRLWGNITDVTASRLAIQERERLDATLRRAERLESLGQLAGGIAHDFNNLLMAILGYVDLAEVDPADAETVRDSLNEIRRAGYRAAELTRELLAFSRRQNIHRQPTNLNDLIASLTRTIRSLLHEHVDLDIIPGHHIGAVSVDPSQIEQVVLNLCTNARDAMLQGGRLTIETQNVLINGEYRRVHPWARPGRYVLLTVSDTGIGIPPDQIHRVFEPFFTTKPPGHGLGLGLSTVYGIIKQHDGMVNVYSEPHVGSTFKVYLPILEQSAARVGQPIQARVQGGNECILIADDEPQVRDILRKILTRAGYDVIVTSNGHEAINAFNAAPDRIDLVLLDMVMPGLGGLEVQAQIRSLCPQKPIIFSSGYAGVVLDTSFFKRPENILLAKPYDPDKLLTLIRQTLDNPPPPLTSA